MGKGFEPMTYQTRVFERQTGFESVLQVKKGLKNESNIFSFTKYLYISSFEKITKESALILL